LHKELPGVSSNLIYALPGEPKTLADLAQAYLGTSHLSLYQLTDRARHSQLSRPRPRTAHVDRAAALYELTGRYE